MLQNEFTRHRVNIFFLSQREREKEEAEADGDWDDDENDDYDDDETKRVKKNQTFWQKKICLKHESNIIYHLSFITYPLC